MINYKVCILAAGKGSRMADFSKHFNKVLLPVQGKPAISHIIEKFPEDLEIVIASGYKADGLKTFSETAYPNRHLTFVNVDPFEGEGSGPGYSLFYCRNHLQSPFISVAGDTLVMENIPAPDSNWLGVAGIQDTSRFCSVKVKQDRVIRIDDKVKTNNEYAYIGLFGVKNYEHFWNSFENNKKIIQGEIQVSNGLLSLLKKDLRIKKFTWFDTGTPNSYAHALENYPLGSSYQGN